MILLHRLALICMMVMVFTVPMDGIGVLSDLPVVKSAGLLAFGFVALLIFSGVAIRGAAWFMVFSLLYVGWTIFSYLWTPMPVDYGNAQAINSQQSVKAHLYLLGAVILMFQVVRSEQDLQRIFLAFLLGSYGLIALFLQDYNPGVTTVRHSLKQLDANEMAVQVAMAIPLALYLLSMSRGWWVRLLGAVYLPLAMLAIIATGSRTGFVVLFIALLGVIPILLRSGLFVKLSSLLGLVVAAGVVISVVPDKTLERVLNTGSELSQGTLNERSITWQKAWREWHDKPLTGHGLGSFRRVVNKHNVDYTAHNSFVSIAVEQGVIGLCLYLAVILLVLYSGIQLDARRRLIVISMVLVVVAGQLTLTLHENLYIWFAYVLAVLALSVRFFHTPADEVES